MNAKLLVWSVVVLLIQVAILSGCSAQIANEATPPTAPVKTVWKYASEQEWIVDSIGRDIAEMLVFAKYRGDSAVKQTPESLNFKTATVDQQLNKYKFEVTLPNTKEPLIYEFVLAGYVWSPANYRPFAQTLLEKLKVKSEPASATPNNFLKTLSDADRHALYKKNERVSKALSEAPLDASLHQQAALLQATFELKVWPAAIEFQSLKTIIWQSRRPILS